MSGLFNTNATGGGGGPTTPANTITRSYIPGVQVRDCVYQTNSGAVDRASAVSIATTPVLGVILALDSPTVGECYVLNDGDMMSYSGLIAGEVYMLSKAPGQLVMESDVGNPNYPTARGNVIQAVGVAMSPSVLLVNIQDQEEL